MPSKKTEAFYKEAYKKFTLLDSGQPSKELAEELDVCPETIRRWRREGRSIRITEERLKVAYDILLAGGGYAEASRKSKISTTNLFEKFPGYGKTVYITDEEIQEAERMLEDGASYEEIGRTLGHSGRGISKRLPGRGWTLEQRIEYMTDMRILKKKVKI